MIFVTVGTQLAFGRLIDAMDRYAAQSGEQVIAQTGPGQGDWPHIDRREYLIPATFEELFVRARVVVGHAGIGTILSARRLNRPLIILPRRYRLGEHRNDHQLATSRRVADIRGIYVAWEAAEIAPLLKAGIKGPPDGETPASAALIARLNTFIENG